MSRATSCPCTRRQWWSAVLQLRLVRRHLCRSSTLVPQPQSTAARPLIVGGTAQTLFAGVVPTNGYLVANNSSATIYVSDVGAATSGGASIPIAAGAVFMTPSGYKPAGAVSLWGGATGQAFAARRW